MTIRRRRRRSWKSASEHLSIEALCVEMFRSHTWSPFPAPISPFPEPTDNLWDVSDEYLLNTCIWEKALKAYLYCYLDVKAVVTPLQSTFKAMQMRSTVESSLLCIQTQFDWDLGHIFIQKYYIQVYYYFSVIPNTTSCFALKNLSIV